jgi:hypothetical protein
MKFLVVIFVASIFSIGIATALGNDRQGREGQDMQMPQPARQATNVDQSACDSKYPSFKQLVSKHRQYITREEANRVPGLKQAFNEADSDHNGKLDEAEYSAWVQSKCISKQPPGRMTPPPV